jgi:serine/threonine protein kinase
MERVKQNILVDSRGRARLSDIGFAKLASTGESTFDWAQSRRRRLSMGSTGDFPEWQTLQTI